MLTFGPGNNYITFKELLSTAAIEKYGDLGRLILDEAYFVPEEVDRDDYPKYETDEIMKLALLEAVKSRQREILNMKSKRASLYAYILSKISKESLDELKRHEDYETIVSKTDPLDL